MENVDQIINTHNIRDFHRWISELSEMGYTSSYKVLNAKDYGVPQSRSRCFMVSAKGDRRFIFPEPRPDGRVMKDILEDEPDESIYLNEDQISGYERHRQRHEAEGHGFGWPPAEPDGIAHTLTTSKDRPSSNFIIVIGDLNDPHRLEMTNRVNSPEGISPTICANVRKSGGPLIEDVRSGKIRIRCLTPRECFRLQGFTDEEFDRAKAVNSASRLYRQAGNSIAVPCLVAIFEGMFIGKTWIRSPSLMGFDTN